METWQLFICYIYIIFTSHSLPLHPQFAWVIQCVYVHYSIWTYMYTFLLYNVIYPIVSPLWLGDIYHHFGRQNLHFLQGPEWQAGGVLYNYSRGIDTRWAADLLRRYVIEQNNMFKETQQHVDWNIFVFKDNLLYQKFYSSLKGATSHCQTYPYTKVPTFKVLMKAMPRSSCHTTTVDQEQNSLNYRGTHNSWGI